MGTRKVRVGNGGWFGGHFVEKAVSKHCGRARWRVCKVEGVQEQEA